MKQNTFKSTLALVAIAILTACGSDELPADPSFDQDIKTELVDKSQLPEWLADYVSYLEYVPEGQELPTEKSGIYRFEWNGQTYYELYSPSQSTLHEEMYTADGVPYRLKLNEQEAFSDGVRNWTIVYIFKPHHGMQNALYPLEASDSVNAFFQNEFNDLRSDIHGFKFQNKDSIADCYIINSQQQLRIIYQGQDKLPAIDFNANTLILGRVKADISFQLKRQEIVVENRTCRLRLFFEQPVLTNMGWVADVVNHYFWALYPKVNDKNLEMKIVTMINNNFNQANTYTWDTSRAPFPSSAIITEVVPNSESYVFDKDTTDWIISKDEEGKITSFTCFQPTIDHEEKLYGCPSSFDDIKYLFPLSEDNEYRLLDIGTDTYFPLNVPMYYETYRQYYKGVPISGINGRIDYFLTTEGKRMCHAYFNYCDTKDIDVNPQITKQQALEILSNYTNMPIEDNWTCSDLEICKFYTTIQGINIPTLHLVYFLEGHRRQSIIRNQEIEVPYTATIDAHTGEILQAGGYTPL